MLYELKFSGPPASVNACAVSLYNAVGNKVIQGYKYSGATYAVFSNYAFLEVDNCGPEAIVSVNAKFQIGKLKYEGETTAKF